MSAPQKDPATILIERLHATAKPSERLDLDIAIAVGEAPNDAVIKTTGPKEPTSLSWFAPSANDRTTPNSKPIERPHQICGFIHRRTLFVDFALQIPHSTETIRADALASAIHRTRTIYPQSWRNALPSHVVAEILLRLHSP